MDVMSLFTTIPLAEQAGQAATQAVQAVASNPGVFTLRNCLILGAVLFSIGAWGVLARRNVLIVLISIELMLNAVNLVFASFARAHANLGHQTAQTFGGSLVYGGESGQIFSLFVIAVAAAEAAVGLAIVITYFRNRESVDTRDMRVLQQ